ncbi:DgyrCDS2287 [Dimorphilus gyrociliatus]|uniref:DgyrCDS2287 n=1 Tax=Dimorphilus gyrociliatus TaxID=2664684 RepID=A0A7I8VBS6_9ANNE|nr:DgyrCDS2287 [Dimorphilus gyrociliatus]
MCLGRINDTSLLCKWINITAENRTTQDQDGWRRFKPALGLLLTTFALITIGAVADLVIGSLVMPFSIVMELTDNVWYFGRDWCDVWHSFDVLASTASILNLSVISLDRYWAITDPIAYPGKMSTGRALILIALVWICSSAISFPAILWWRATVPEPIEVDKCAFTEDVYYLIFSSIISFYCPVFIIMFAYYKIYVAACEQTRSLKCGSKVLVNDGQSGETMTLRMHRGGAYRYAETTDSDSECPNSPAHLINPNNCYTQHIRPPRMVSRKWKHFALSRKLSKLAKEQKAAKTLGIVIGVFCICWVPFFVLNVLTGLCSNCIKHGEILFPVFTWLGYINSGMNPVIYACSMKDFRRAFSKILFHWCPKNRLRTRRNNRYNAPLSNSSFSVNYSDHRSNSVVRL